MAFGIYFHIPYCLQRCTYCDFATYEKSQILPPEDYVQLLFKEIAHGADLAPSKEISTIYFGGGTPSLLNPELIVSLILRLEKHGFVRSPDCEITLEINPATLTDSSLRQYVSYGFNRFSVGAQTFDDRLLRSVNREHTANQTRETLSLLKSYSLNFSFDLLFALPHQSLQGLEQDLNEIEVYKPPHISPYCLTVPEGHVLSKNRPLEDHQIQMFNMINSFLTSLGYSRYEISNFSLPGFESKHNCLYWNPDSEYWGIGLSAHSYFKKDWGLRFWNNNSIGKYQTQIAAGDFRPSDQMELLKKHQALTDFCHVSLRKKSGLDLVRLEQRFGTSALNLVQGLLATEADRGHLNRSLDSRFWSLTDSGILISNQVFSSFTFLEHEVAQP